MVEDELVMQEVREGAVGRLEVLFDRHHAAILRYFQYLTSNRTLSEDLAQEVFFRVLKYRQTFQTGGNFRPWLYQIARNVYADVAAPQMAAAALAHYVRQAAALLGEQPLAALEAGTVRFPELLHAPAE